VNRAPGSLYALDADGFVRNTYLLKITNKEAVEADVAYAVRLDGLDDAQMVAPAGPVMVAPEESVTVPLVIRVPEREDLRRTIPFQVRVGSEGVELLLPTTFKTGARVGGDD
jgi:hypothetical protein